MADETPRPTPDAAPTPGRLRRSRGRAERAPATRPALRSRSRRSQGQAAAHAGGDGEPPPAHRARDRRHAPICRRQLRPRHADGRRQPSPRHRRRAARNGARTATRRSTALIEGVEVTERGLEQSLAKFGVKRIEAKGQKFDPALPSGDVRGRDRRRAARHGRRGDAGRLRDRRAGAQPALVGVAKAPAKPRRRPAPQAATTEQPKRPTPRTTTPTDGSAVRLAAFDRPTSARRSVSGVIGFSSTCLDARGDRLGAASRPARRRSARGSSRRRRVRLLRSKSRMARAAARPSRPGMWRSMRISREATRPLGHRGDGGGAVAHLGDRVAEAFQHGADEQRVDLVVLGQQHVERVAARRARRRLRADRHRRDRCRSRLAPSAMSRRRCATAKRAAPGAPDRRRSRPRAARRCRRGGRARSAPPPAPGAPAASRIVASAAAGSGGERAIDQHHVVQLGRRRRRRRPAPRASLAVAAARAVAPAAASARASTAGSAPSGARIRTLRPARSDASAARRRRRDRQVERGSENTEPPPAARRDA